MRSRRLVPMVALIGTLFGVVSVAEAREPTLVIDDGDCSYSYYIDWYLGFFPIATMEADCVSVDVTFEEIVD